ncbi:hypothetical protein MUN88_04295 [Gracilibacillus caseinilyticus]|uniref:DUF5673 domain-containing protein n=1 Tax=Gracilibacillus caseinilyticus TaxID=2932256 RepID=A0ABY4F4E9_9BACI|nr:hypothetical protein [Gracilibacillus caseinilyticus]UOQ49346.1 hypothetical protein MUN88_04295 [Gracilibacillus caseinilyticus]
MEILINLVFLAFIIYYNYKLIQVLWKMKKQIILPTTSEELKSLRRYPQKTVDFPSYSTQKTALIMYAFILLFLSIIFIVDLLSNEFQSIYLVFFPAYIYSHQLFNIFAVVDEGVISGSRFIPWEKMKSFQLIPIDINHKYYGFEKEVNNNGFELKIKTGISSISCIITSEELKINLVQILNKKIHHQSGDLKWRNE